MAMKPAFGRKISPGSKAAFPANRAAHLGGFGKSADIAQKKNHVPTVENKVVSDASIVDKAFDLLQDAVQERLDPAAARQMERNEVTGIIEGLIEELLSRHKLQLNDLERRDLLTVLLNDLLTSESKTEKEKKEEEENVVRKQKEIKVQSNEQKQQASHDSIMAAKDRLQPLLLEYIDASAANEMDRAELAEQVSEAVNELMAQEKINLNLREQRELVNMLLHDMLGLGPLEPLLEDETITEIMVNGPKQVYIEKKGKLTLSDVTFRDEAHLMNICTRIVTAVGRRVDETTPICDARLADGSRVNIIIPPLAIDGASISIRKFAKQKITLDKMIDFGSLSHQMGTVLKIASACRLNILISGGTGSGKTTMLNALSRMIDEGERVVTIEDTAELQLQQPHVVRLETRPPNLEGKGEISMRDLVKNALRMRPDRIILGEVRGAEAFDVLQAMNTGHDGSMCTLHANNPREALTRMENMIGMADLKLPPKAVREQIASAVDLIVQVSRMRDGGRRTCAITEVVGMEGDVITTQDLFVYEFTGEDADGKLLGRFRSTGVRPHFTEKAEYYGLHRALLEAI
ncbi:CpaF family protein [Luteithermobacter gelatinilyticus]|uniref:CpaF family protein n=1 Tax=Luteithermobacter gelatinilyticus TaxID=2582913 RepID=UPI001AF0006C|nr:CpaF family protein [Luteithermobacter gelatinilyticus]|tara:strand:+ start:670 stop:2397 length:1728 start_codon:yes stop_codon:yes gene_type:complete